MAAFGSSNFGTTNSTSSQAVTKPTGLAAGDLLIAFCTDEVNTDFWNTPAGWTRVATATGSGSNSRTVVFAKVADSTDAAAVSFSFTLSSATRVLVLLYRITGTFTSASNIYVISALATTDAGSNIERGATGITPSVASSLLIMHLYVTTSGTTPTTNNWSAYAIQTSDPGSWNETLDNVLGTTGINSSVASAYVTRTQVTDTGYFQATSVVPMSANFIQGVLLAVADSQNGSVSPAVIALSETAYTPGAGGGVSPAVIPTTVTAYDPTASSATAKWQNTTKATAASLANTAKSSAAAITNTAKSSAASITNTSKS